jgi:hypothetical protein
MLIPVHFFHKGSPFSISVRRGDRRLWEVGDVIPKDPIQRIMEGDVHQSRFDLKEFPANV